MIKLDIENYCHECPDFEGMVQKKDMSYTTCDSKFRGDVYYTVKKHDTTISCVNKDRCAAIKERIEKDMVSKGERKNE